MTSKELQARLAGLWTVADIAKLFDVTPMTVHLWRMNRDLPVIIIPGEQRPAVRFDKDDVMKWATKNGLRLRPIQRRQAA